MRTLAIPTLLVVTAFTAAGAQAGQGDFHWEKALAAGSEVRVHNISGDVDVVPSTTGRVEVTGHRTRGADADLRVVVQERSGGIDVCVVHADDDCDPGGIHGRHDHWGGDEGDINLRVAVPGNLQVSANSVSGNVGIDGAQGDVQAHTVSGDVKLQHLRASSLTANSVSGSIDAQLDALTGNGDLEFRSVSGDVTLNVPRDFGADLRMRTVSGDLTSDFPVTLNGGFGRRSIEARIGGGGRRLDVSTVSGDVRIRGAK